HTTMARFWAQDRVATFALVEPLARVRRHCFVLGMPTLRARQNRVQDQIHYGFAGATDDGNPASVVALVSTSTLTLVSSKTTVVSRLARLDLTPMTPSIWVSAFFTVMGQVAQLMPGTDRVTLCWAAQPGVSSKSAAVVMINRFMSEPFISRTSGRTGGTPARPPAT